MTTATASLTNDVLTLADEVTNYFGGDYEGYTQIEKTLEAIETRFRAAGITDGSYDGRLVLLSKAQLDALGSALDGFSPHPCTDDHDDHGDESACFGYGPKTLEALAEAQTILMEAAR